MISGLVLGLLGAAVAVRVGEGLAVAVLVRVAVRVGLGVGRAVLVEVSVEIEYGDALGLPVGVGGDDTTSASVVSRSTLSTIANMLGDCSSHRPQSLASEYRKALAWGSVGTTTPIRPWTQEPSGRLPFKFASDALRPSTTADSVSLMVYSPEASSSAPPSTRNCSASASCNSGSFGQRGTAS